MGGACGKTDSPKASAKSTSAGVALKATEKEFSVTFDKATVAAGAVRVTVANAGAVEHELVAFKSDLPLDQFPLDGTKVDENGSGITHFDPEAEDIVPGKSKTITLHLSAGRYVFLCNVPGHYAAGMRAELTVA
jgi:uncharacterized cupredoxin-like copper-binding protein